MNWFMTACNRRFFATAVIGIAVASLAKAQFVGIVLQPAGYGDSLAVGASGNDQIGSANAPANNLSHAILWHGSATAYVDLNPTGMSESYGEAIDGQTQVGFGGVGGHWHALMWSGSAASMVDLNPAGITTSYCYGISGNIQVGVGEGPLTGGAWHALMWHGTAGSVIDLGPTSSWSEALGASGDLQVGLTANQGATIWHGSADNPIYINQTGFRGTNFRGASGDEQVGEVYTSDSTSDAGLWRGTENSFVNLNPTWSNSSEAYGVSGNVQVGWAYQNGFYNPEYYRAVVWYGTASSAIDLNPYVTFQSRHPNYAYAFGVDGNTIVGQAFADPNGTSNPYAVMWRAVPEPGSLAFLSLGLVVLLKRRGRS